MSASEAIANVQSRIAEIQTRLNGGARATTNSNASFQTTLNSVLGESTTNNLVDSLSSYSSSSSNDGGSAAVDAGMKYLGTPYVYGSNDPSKGLDCSSLLQRAYADVGISLPRVAADQAREGTAVPSLAQAKPGDLVAFGSPVDHIGMYVGNNKMLVAPHSGDVVKIQDVYKTPTAIRRIVPDMGSSVSSSFGAATSLNSSGIGSSLRSQYDSLFTQAGAKYGLPPNLLAAVAKQESGFNARAGSGAGAQGLMQIMPGTAKSLGVDPWDPTQAVDGAARMISGLVKKFGSVDLALAGYNAGAGAVQKHNGIPPYKETQNYVKNILAMTRQGGGL